MPIANPSRAPGAEGHEQHELLRWVAELYYLQNQGQADIAALIGASVSKVSRLLAEARRQGQAVGAAQRPGGGRREGG